MQHALDLELVSSGAIGVEYHLAIAKEWLADFVCQSAFLMGPGRDVFVVVGFGLKRKSRRDEGLPLSTMPHHCSHLRLQLGTSAASIRALPMSTSSASTSLHSVSARTFGV